jgi:hypothetical protein
VPTFERPEDLEEALRSATASALPGVTVRRIRRTIVSVKLRIDLDARLFVDAFFNARNQRTDLSLVAGDRRIFGYDNLGGWHRHPVDGPDRHEDCPAPTLMQFLVEVVSLRQRGR